MYRILRTILVTFILMSVPLESLLIFNVYNENNPTISAEQWYKAFIQADFQNVISLTCNLKINEIQNSINSNPTSNISDSDLSEIDFKFAKSDGNFIVSGENFAIIDAKGKTSVQINLVWYYLETNQRWLFIYEDYRWKWCGSLEPPPVNDLPNLVTISVLGSVLVVVVLITLASQKQAPKEEEEYLQFLSLPDEDDAIGENILAKYVNYEVGEIKSINKSTGAGIVETSDGEKYYINQKSVIGKGNKKLNTGDDILFQKSWEGKGKKTKNIIKVHGDSTDLSPYSTWLRKLTQKTKRLRKNLRYYKFAYIQSELNTCNAMLELLNDYASKNDVKLAPHEVVLTNIIERDLNEISGKAESNQNRAPWWSGILRFVLQMLSILSDFISIASPSIGRLLESIGTEVNRLLGGRKRPPSLGPGDE